MMSDDSVLARAAGLLDEVAMSLETFGETIATAEQGASLVRSTQGLDRSVQVLQAVASVLRAHGPEGRAQVIAGLGIEATRNALLGIEAQAALQPNEAEVELF